MNIKNINAGYIQVANKRLKKQFDEQLIIESNQNKNVILIDKNTDIEVSHHNRNKSDYERKQYIKKMREVKYQRYIEKLRDENPDVKRAEKTVNGIKKKVFKWCTCHIYKSEKKINIDDTCFKNCECYK